MIIACTSVLITYEGHPPTCYVCNEQDYLNQNCPRRRQTGTQRGDTYKHSWANVVTQGPMRQETATMSDTVPSQQSIHEVRRQIYLPNYRGGKKTAPHRRTLLMRSEEWTHKQFICKNPYRNWASNNHVKKRTWTTNHVTLKLCRLLPQQR